jgi:hypothetical protein
VPLFVYVLDITEVNFLCLMYPQYELKSQPSLVTWAVFFDSGTIEECS